MLKASLDDRNMKEMICANCTKTVPTCGHKRKVSEGYCRDCSLVSSKETPEGKA